ncbi:aspartyl/asparaginyl beta-hydroxylase isoform X2 [Pararge aegeria]|uniref:aspartyl/asparaginyl beta-hydroxylase isoform X2 n=1 Tax=Pararge aegeria TaxID=116150 RepID=UPI0019CFD56B|nr:aspartyl/asparaginyl beta-hydroxylase isoform X2 [Pararge aegeria]
MSGDVQPRKRKDKKKKKDELTVDDPRGTAAALGDGDVFIHSQQDHGTGGHWCAKVIFFSLLAVLITLIGLIILENRGLTELEANSVESRYSGVLEGWLEDSPDDDHHDEHTLDLKHHDDEDDDEEHNVESNEEDDEDEDHEDDEDEEDQESDHEEDEEDDSREDNIEADEDEEDRGESQEEDTEGGEDEEENVAGDIEDSNEEQDADNDDNQSEENLQDDDIEDDEEQGDEKEEDDEEEEIEKIEQEVVDEDEGYYQEASNEYASREADDDDGDDDDNDLQEEDDDDEPPLERITAPPAGKPFVEIEEEVTEKPINTLAEEEEYEKQQEQLRKEQEEEAAQGSQMWLKLAVGGALLVATHAVLRRATAPRDIPEPEEYVREETPSADERMTIVPEQSSPRVQQEGPVTQIARDIEEDIFKKPAPVTKSAPIIKQDSEEEVIVKKVLVEKKAPVVDKKDEEKELYSDEEEEEEVEDEEEEEEDIEEPIKEPVQTKAVSVSEQKPTETESEPEDVEIIDDDQIEEELEEEDEDEEEISDVDDTELLSRLEAKYGRLPEPERFGYKPEHLEQKNERFGQKHKDGGNSIEDDWPGEPSEAYWRRELNVAEEELRQGAWSSSEKRASVPELANSGRARWIIARALDLSAEAKRDNRLLSRAIAAYLHLLKMNERLPDKKLLEVAQRTIDRIQFRGTYLNAEPIYRLLIRRFPENVHYRNNLTVSFLMANRADLADEVLKETLRLSPNDRVALAHHGFVLKTHYNKLEEAVNVLYKALEGDTGPAIEPRFYYHLGDALLLLSRFEEAHEVHKRGAALGHFLSPAQRSLYNVPRLKSQPWWPVKETPYTNLARALERSWRDILKEGEAAKALYEKEKEGLKERGEWSQLDLFARGAEIPGRCAQAPKTCAIVRSEAAAAGCRRGQVKFSLMAAGTHVRPHVGPTNCRLRMHLGLSNTKDTYIRVDKETRQWQTGKTFIFDDSFEHEVWHNGSGSRLVLIVDVWHPELTAAERRSLPAI